jgi:hypothetical protein
MKYMICFAAPTPCLECQCFSTMQIFECSPACGEVFEPFVSRVQAIASCTANCCLKLSAFCSGTSAEKCSWLQAWADSTR